MLRQRCYVRGARGYRPRPWEATLYVGGLEAIAASSLFQALILKTKPHGCGITESVIVKFDAKVQLHSRERRTPA